MGIFKESLSKYVENQLNLRQNIIRTSTDRSTNGLFHAYTTNKYCNIRMASGVDITNLPGMGNWAAVASKTRK